MAAEFDGIEVTLGGDPTSAVIWLHGLGADGYDFEPIVAELGLRASVRFVFPHAPVRPVTINGGTPMRAWYDIVGFGASARQDEAGVRASGAYVGRLVEREAARGVPPERVVLAGFSQGGAVALYAGLREPRAIAGILALSTYLPLADTLAAERSAANAAVPIFMAHGTADGVVPLALGEGSRRRLESAGYAVDWRDYPMAHAVCAREIADIGVWLAARFAPS
jgi:phospholipase/carboxylesterase